MQELLDLRNENSKIFAIGSNKYRAETSIGAVHYKDNYADELEPWKDINLNWEGNRITKAPYELTLEDKKLTIKDKKTGEVSTIELLGAEPTGLAWEIIPEYSKVRFRHTVSSDKIPFEAKFRVTGRPFIARAFDDECELPLEATLKDGILTERLSTLPRVSKGDIRIDPTYQVGVSEDNCHVYWNGSAWILHEFPTYGHIVAGYSSAVVQKRGSGMRFLNVSISKGATIDSAYLTLRASITLSAATVNTRLVGEDADNAATFSTLANYQARRGTVVGGANNDNITTAVVDWDAIAGWTLNADKNSPSIVSVIHEIVSRDGWSSGNAMVIYWDDYDNRSTAAANVARAAYSYDGSATFAPKLVVTFTFPPLSWRIRIGGVTYGVQLVDLT